MRETEPHKTFSGRSVRAKTTQREPRLCPTCWNVMRLERDGSWWCEKHGKATRP